MKFGRTDNYILPLILLFCLCGDNRKFDNILGDIDIEEILPWLLVLFFCCGDLLEDLLGDIEDWLPWLLLAYCCFFRDC